MFPTDSHCEDCEPGYYPKGKCDKKCAEKTYSDGTKDSCEACDPSVKTCDVETGNAVTCPNDSDKPNAKKCTEYCKTAEKGAALRYKDTDKCLCPLDKR